MKKKEDTVGTHVHDRTQRGQVRCGRPAPLVSLQHEPDPETFGIPLGNFLAKPNNGKA